MDNDMRHRMLGDNPERRGVDTGTTPREMVGAILGKIANGDMFSEEEALRFSRLILGAVRKDPNVGDADALSALNVLKVQPEGLVDKTLESPVDRRNAEIAQEESITELSQIEATKASLIATAQALDQQGRKAMMQMLNETSDEIKETLTPLEEDA